jgi:HAE1 family hydrophobic/amphiphilic exporter-1
LTKPDLIKAKGSFFRFTTERPVTILMIMIGVVVFGYISYKQLPLNLMPDMTYPSLTVRTEYPGTAPEEIETTISRPIEQALGVVDNLVTISSISKAEQSDVVLEFTWDTDMDKAIADIREKLDQVFLPKEVKRPIILRFDPTLDPIIRLGLYGDRPLTYLRYLGEEDIKRILETVDGVAAVKVKGGLEEEIRVELDEQKLTLIGMDIQTVKNRLMQENVNLAGGNLKEGKTEYLVRTLNEFKSIKEIEEVVIGSWGGADLKVKDIGHVYRTHKERQIITRIAGKESVEIEIYKEADANIVAVAERIKNKLYGTPEQQAYAASLKNKDKKKKKAGGEKGKGSGRFAGMREKSMTNFLSYALPEGIHITTLSDQSIFIKNSIDEVKKTAVQGGLLAILVLFIFLRRLGPTLIIGLAIPISIVATFAPMKIFDVSLNIMSLGGLALGIGMLVDNSIVVLESIARCKDEGDNLINATIRGVQEVGGAVTASTLTTIAVFFPIVFVEGVAGQIFGDMALTVVFSLLASLGVALFLIPMLSSRQSDAFIKGVDVKTVPKEYILNFNSGKLEIAAGASFSDRIILWFKEIYRVLVESFFKIFKAVYAFLFSIVKQVILIVLNIVRLFAALLSIIKINFLPAEKVLTYANADRHHFAGFVNAIWPQYLVFSSTQNLYDDFSNISRRFKSYSLLKRIIYLPFMLIRWIMAVLKYCIHNIFELSFRFIHMIIVFIGIALNTVFLLSKLLFAYPVKLFLDGFNYFYGKVEEMYPPLLKKSLDYKYSLIGGVVVLFLFSIFIVMPRVGSELIPEVHQGEFFVEITFPVGTPVEDTDARINPILDRIQKINYVASVASVAGTDKSATSDSEMGEHTAKITVLLKANSNFQYAEEKTIAEIREMLKHYPGMSVKISHPTLFSFKTPIEVHLQGYNLTNLQKYSAVIEKKMEKIPGVVDAKSNIQRGNPEVQIYYNRSLLARYNLNVRDVASIVRNKIRGDVATEFKEEDRRIDILVRLREADKESIDQLRRIVVNPGQKIPIPLEVVAKIRVNEGPSEIRRINQQRTAVISANIAPGYDLKNINETIYSELHGMDFPEGFTFELAGQNQEMETSLNSLMLALALAIFLVYIVMASQFESIIHPFVIIFTIPFALIGVIIALYILRIPLSIVVFLGIIMLAGIVVNNAIVLVDYINHLRRSGLKKTEAIIEAGKVRLRPILMTTATTVLGLLPMAIGMGDGAEIRAPMAITVIVGLITSTLLTLVIIPTVYDVVSREA